MANNRTILLVEHEADDSAVLRELQASGVCDEIITVSDGAQAVDRLTGASEGQEPRPLPRLVLMAVDQPRTDGFRALDVLRSRERTRLLPVVVLTPAAGEEDMLEGYRHGANSHVRKPADPADLADVVRQIARYWLLLNESPPI